MRKVVIALSGDSESKNEFDKILKSNGFWVWNANSRNYLSFIVRKNFGWSGNRTPEFYSFLEEMKSLLDKTFDFELDYTKKLIQRLDSDEKTKVLILHSCSENVLKDISADRNNVYSIHVTETPPSIGMGADYLVVNDENYEGKITAILKEITKETEIDDDTV